MPGRGCLPFKQQSSDSEVMCGASKGLLDLKTVGYGIFRFQAVVGDG